MLPQYSRTAIFMALALIGLSACSGDKNLPQGKRISVLQENISSKTDVVNAQKYIRIPQSLSNSAWLQTDLNNQHTGQNLKVGTDFIRQWKADFGTGISKREFLLAKPLVKNGKVYTLDADGTLSVFNLTDGERLWQLDILSQNSNIKSTALKDIGMAMYEDKIYLTTGFGNVVALAAKDGKQIWSKNLQTPLRIAPLVDNGKVFIQSADNHFFALNAASGEILWDYDIAIENTTLVGGAIAAYHNNLDIVVTGFSNGEIQSFNASLGTPLWSDLLVSNYRAYSSTFLHTIKASPIIDDEVVYVVGTSDIMTALNIRNGERLWEKSISAMQTPLLIADTLYVVDNNRNLLAVNKNTGDILWKTALELHGKAGEVNAYSPLMLDNRLVVALSNGYVQTYDAKTGNMLSSVDLDEDINSAPIVADGYILFTTSNAKILAYK